MQKHFKFQLKENLVALISLVIAIMALLYTAWREEITEKNRTLRAASFEILKNLGELQITVNYMHYQPNNRRADPFIGWGHVAFVSDLSQLLPGPVPEKIESLSKVWAETESELKISEAKLQQLSKSIDEARESILETIRQLT